MSLLCRCAESTTDARVSATIVFSRVDGFSYRYLRPIADLLAQRPNAFAFDIANRNEQTT
jgi:hypothetical protein